jgi:hypothetical protein
MTGSGLAFVTTRDPPGVRIEDRVSGRQYAIRTAGDVDPSPVDGDALAAPVDECVAVETTELRVPDHYSVYVRDEGGELLQSVVGETPATVPRGDHYLELGTPVKTYLRIGSEFECTNTQSGIRVRLPRRDRVVVGARPWQVAPETAITVTDDPGDLLVALSQFGSALHSLSPERSFPTLRGHPPQLRVGDALDVPETVEPPESGVTIAVPPTLPAAYAVAPLAYYLAATVVPGDRFEILTDDGPAYAPPVDADRPDGGGAGETNNNGNGNGNGNARANGRGLARAVRRVLTRCFTLDCLVRTVGRYPVDLQARHEFEARSDVDLDYETLYDLSLAERTARYLRVPHEPVAAVAPRWPIVAVVEPGPLATEALASLVDRFALVRPGDPPRYRGTEARSAVLQLFTASDDTPVRSTSLVYDGEAAYVDVPETDGDRTVWVGEGVPLGAAKYLAEGVDHRNRRATELTASGPLRIDIVSNEAPMDIEPEAVEECYEIRSDRPLDTEIHYRLATTGLERLIESGTDLLHFVGHASAEGLDCPDGTLDVATVDESRVDAFYLNACESYRQGRLLVERGSVGGVVTHSRVADTRAAEVGVAVARLLNVGYPLGAAVEVVRSTTDGGGQYAAIGDESVCLAQPAGGCPYLPVVASGDADDAVRLRIRSLAADACRWGLGSMNAYHDVSDSQHLVSGRAGPFEVTVDELRTFAARSPGALVIDGELRWRVPDEWG